MYIKYKSIYLFSSLFSSTVVYFLPLYYLNHGFTPTQIGILNSVGLATAIVSPFFGMLAEKKYSAKGVMIFNSCMAFSALLFLLFSDSFVFVFFLILIYGIFQNPLFAINDMYVSSFTEHHDLNFGKFRRFFGLGWGAAVFFTLPAVYIFGPNGFLIAAMLYIIIYLICLLTTKDYSTAKKSSNSVKYGAQLKLLLHNKEYVLIVLFACLYWGITKVRIQYQPILFNEHISSNLLVAVACLLAMLPELILLPYYPKVKNRLKFGGMMGIVLAMSITQLFILAFVDNGYILAFTHPIQGFMAFIYFPTIIFSVRKVVPQEIRVTAMLILGSVLSVVSVAVSFFVVTPVYANFGVEPVFFVIALLSTLALYPLIKLRNLKI